jgi:NDP-sugar pyrophosphorylase family protein
MLGIDDVSSIPSIFIEEPDMSRSPTPTPCATRHAVILAAGESKRTRPLTSYRPKPLIPLLGKPLLAHILDELVGLVDRATLVVGYRADEIKATFGHTYRAIELRYVIQEQVNGTAGALRAVGQIDEPFFLLYGDNLIAHADVVGVCQALPSLAGLHVEDARSFGVLQIEGSRVLGILEKPADPPPNALANPGIFHLDPAAFPALDKIRPSPRGEYELTDLVALLAAERPVGYHICSGFWVPVGNPWEALSAAQFLLARRAGLSQSVSPLADIAADVQIEGAVTIGRARIGAGSRIIGPTVIGDGCVVGVGCVIEQSSLESGALVVDGAFLRDSVIGAGVRVGAGSRAESSWLDDGSALGERANLPAQVFAKLQPTADTGGLLSRAMLCTRGAVLGRGVRLEAETGADPGSIINAQ